MKFDIYLMFSDYSQSFKLKWGRIINAGFDKIVPELEAESKKYSCNQIVEKEFITWYDKSSQIQAMFCFPLNAKDFDAILATFNTIKQYNSPVSFIFIHQESDGEGNYDIFRISERSCLEHNNRVRFRRK
jgi:hypothetical protein